MPLRLKAVMFTDRVGSSAGATHAGDAVRVGINELLDRFTREAVEKADGRVIKFLGDGHLITFDSAAQALRGGWRLQQRLDEHNRTTAPDEPIRLRIGIDAGDVEERLDGDVTGHAVDMAKRVESAAAPGEVCYSERVRALLPTRFADDEGHPAPGQPTALKGDAQPTQLYRLVQLHDTGPDTFSSPFVVSRPVSEPPEFFGRAREIRELLAPLRNSQSRSVVGAHRIGKSSLLRHVAARLRREEGWPVAHLDMRNIAHHSLAGVLGVAHAQFGLSGPVGTLAEFNDRFREAAAAGLRAVLIFDGIEVFVRNRQQFAEDFCDTLRSLASEGNLTLLTASQRGLRELNESGHLLSALYTIAPNLDLGPFTTEEAAAFVAQPRPGVEFTAEEQREIVARAENHPLRLQWLCHAVLMAKQEPAPEWSRVWAEANGQLAGLLGA